MKRKGRKYAILMAMMAMMLCSCNAENDTVTESVSTSSLESVAEKGISDSRPDWEERATSKGGGTEQRRN